MSYTMADLWAFIHSHPLGAWLIPVYSYCTTEGGDQNIYDTYLFQDIGGYTIGPQLAGGNIIYRPTAVSVLDRERGIGGNSGIFVNTDNGGIYSGGAAYVNHAAANDLYMITTVRPRIMFDILCNVTLRKYPIPIDMPAERFTNAACESATGWSVSGAGSVATTTTAANVQTGTISLFFSAGTAGEYLKSPTFRVDPSRSYFVTANVRADVGGPFYLALWDETNNVEINVGGRNSTSLEQFTVLTRTEQTPSTCEEASVRIYCTNNTDRGYIDYVNGPWSQTDKLIQLPSWVTRANAIRKVQTSTYKGSISGMNNAYDAYSRDFDMPFFGPKGKEMGRDYNIRISPTAANTSRIEFSQNVRIPNKELWIEAERPAFDFVTPAFTAAGETVPTFPFNQTPEGMGLSWIRDCAAWVIANVNKDDPQAQASLAGIVGSAQEPGELAQLMADYEADMQTRPTYLISNGHGRVRF